MVKRLNDTRALSERPIRGGDTPDPAAGGACCRRSPRLGEASVAFTPEGGVEVLLRPEPSAGSESLRGATAYLGERIGERGR
jgi:hypothetical protein